MGYTTTKTRLAVLPLPLGVAIGGRLLGSIRPLPLQVAIGGWLLRPIWVCSKWHLGALLMLWHVRRPSIQGPSRGRLQVEHGCNLLHPLLRVKLLLLAM